MVLSEPLARETARDYATRVLKDNIIRLELAPGSMVSESELAQQMGLSRTPVREALIELSRVKIVEVAPQRGSRIALIDYKLVEEASFVRRTLECAVVERCCERGIDAALPGLAESIQLQHYFLKNEMESRFLEEDNAFHRRLFTAVDLEQTWQLVNGMTIHLDRVRMMSIKTHTGRTTVGEHEALLEAIRARDGEKARQVMYGHLTRYQVDKQGICALYPDYVKT